jgi:hypothetical protein
MAAWVLFAGILLLIVGGLDIMQGVIALFDDEYFVVGKSGFLVVDLTAWGWIMVIWGGLLVLAGVGLAAGQGWARWFAIVVVGLNFIAQLGFLGNSQYPLWALTALALNVIVLYALTFFSANLGPNTTTFILPAELFPARFRSTCHGISAAAGKVGALVGSVGFLWASQARHRGEVQAGYERGIGMMNALVILGAISLLGLAVTYFFTPETMGRSLEENESNEQGDQDLQDGDGGMTMRLQDLNLTPKSPVSLVSSHVSSSPIHPHRFSV